MKIKSQAADPGTSSAAPQPEELELARKIHVLAGIVHGQLVATHPWVAAPGLPGAALAYPAALPGAFSASWTVPAVWPRCP